ncbi:MAG: hypothetical protein R3C14_29245 [Caldilineaceae bacterium]
MLYLVGGAARSGKSTVAQRFVVQTVIPYFCLDYLMMGFANGAPSFGVNPEDDELQVATLLTPVIRSMAVAMLENGEEYLLEGVQLHPRLAAELCREFPGQVRVCFLGYAEADLNTKMHQIRHLNGGTNDWLRDYDDGQLLTTVARLQHLSATVQGECIRHGLPYFETAVHFERVVDEVVTFLRTGSASPMSSPRRQDESARSMPARNRPIQSRGLEVFSNTALL